MNLLLRAFHLTLCFFSFSTIAFAQNALTPDYIVRNNGDTLRGIIEDHPQYELWESVGYKSRKEDRQFQEFTTGDIRSIQSNGQLYKPVTFKNTQIDAPGVYSGFGKLLMEGYYELFHIYQNNESYFVVRHDTSTFFLYQRTDDDGLPMHGAYQNLLNYFSSDCPVNKKILKTNFNEKELSDFLLQVNACLGKGSAQVGVSHFQNPPAKLNFVLFAGGFPGSSSKSQYVIDGEASLSFPQWDRKVSLNLGFRYTSINSTAGLINFSNQPFTIKENQKISSIPFTFKYNFLSRFIQLYPLFGFSYAIINTTVPTVNPLSLSVDSPYPPAPGNTTAFDIIFGGGMEVHPFKGLFIRGEWRHETRSQDVVFGLGYKF
jgi:hypothetical protein